MRGRRWRPPVSPRALLDVVLREAGVWAMPAVNLAEAAHVLARMAFELVVVDMQDMQAAAAPPA